MVVSPVVVFAYDRPDHLNQTLSALAGNDLACETELFVYCDGARECGGEEASRLKSNEGETYITKRYGVMYCSKEEYESYLARIESTRQVAHLQKGFKNLHVIEREKNIGLADNIVGAVSKSANI